MDVPKYGPIAAAAAGIAAGEQSAVPAVPNEPANGNRPELIAAAGVGPVAAAGINATAAAAAA